MRRIVVKWKQESRKDSRETPQFRAVLTFEGTCKKVSAVEVCGVAALGEEAWTTPKDQSRISDEQILMRAIEVMAAHFVSQTQSAPVPDRAWYTLLGSATITTFLPGDTRNLEIDLGTVRP